MKWKLLNIAKFAAKHILCWLTHPIVVAFLGKLFFWFLGRRHKGQIDLLQARRVLVVRLDEIGDMIMTTPFLRELRRNLPDAWITLVVKPAVYNLLELCPYVNEVLTYDWKVSRYLGPLQRHWRALCFAYRHLWRRRFDLSIIPRWDADSYHATFLAYFSGASWRVGYSEDVIASKKRLNKGFDLLLTHVLKGSSLKHEVEHNLDVIRFLGGGVQDDHLELWQGEEDKAFAEDVLKKRRIQPNTVIVGLCPSSGNSILKQWPKTNFIELGRWLQEKYSAYILLIGGPGEEPLGWEMEQKLNPQAINMIGRTTLRQMGAMLKRCHLHIGNDAGPMHMAVAMGIPTVVLFGSSCPHRFGPWGNNCVIIWSGLPCSTCIQKEHLDRCESCIFNQPRCMLAITVDQVKQAVDLQLRRIPGERLKQLGTCTRH